jgi:hypothetical protein
MNGLKVPDLAHPHNGHRSRHGHDAHHAESASERRTPKQTQPASPNRSDDDFKAESQGLFIVPFM